MQTRRTLDPLEPKTWQLEDQLSGAEGYLYYCVLCDEALVLSKQEINPRKIRLVFNETCPGCGFELEKVLGCKPSILPRGRRLLTSLKCKDAEVLLEPDEQIDPQLRRGSDLTRDQRPNLTTGIESIDKTLILRLGQLVFLQGEPSNSLSLLLCVRATLPAPKGLDSDVVFIDAGNLFDTYAISQHSIGLALDNEKVQNRIRLSRAFTHHQVYSLIMDKLPSELDESKAKLAVVSDITALFCDPDVREKRESTDIFRRGTRFLATLAEQRSMIILVTSQATRNRAMEGILKQKAHVSVILKDRGAYTQLTVVRHPFRSERDQEVTLDNHTLVGYSQ